MTGATAALSIEASADSEFAVKWYFQDIEMVVSSSNQKQEYDSDARTSTSMRLEIKSYNSVIIFYYSTLLL